MVVDNRDKLQEDIYAIKQISIADEVVLTTQIVDVQGTKVLFLSGYIDAYSLPLFINAMMCILNEVERHLIIDMHDVEYMDSSGFGTLISAIKRLIPKAGTINLIGCSPTISRLFHVTHLDTIISLYQNMDDAMEAISQIAGADGWVRQTRDLQEQSSNDRSMI